MGGRASTDRSAALLIARCPTAMQAMEQHTQEPLGSPAPADPEMVSRATITRDAETEDPHNMVSRGASGSLPVRGPSDQ
jgi:hypothetical protein